jgi:hypothetical protein
VKRAEFDHVIKAAPDIVKDEIVVVSSQSDAIREGLADVGRLRRGVDLVPQNVREIVAERLEGLIARIAR